MHARSLRKAYESRKELKAKGESPGKNKFGITRQPKRPKEKVDPSKQWEELWAEKRSTSFPKAQRFGVKDHSPSIRSYLQHLTCDDDEDEYSHSVSSSGQRSIPRVSPGPGEYMGLDSPFFKKVTPEYTFTKSHPRFPDAVSRAQQNNVKYMCPEGQSLSAKTWANKGKTIDGKTRRKFGVDQPEDVEKAVSSMMKLLDSGNKMSLATTSNKSKMLYSNAFTEGPRFKRQYLPGNDTPTHVGPGRYDPGVTCVNLIEPHRNSSNFLSNTREREGKRIAAQSARK